jgi:tetraacyldisaccharide 4'-kinase
LLSATEFRNLASGKRRGLSAALLRSTFAVAEVGYRFGINWRNRRFDDGKSEICGVDVPVISVGNITTGGTGKTPMVQWLARWFRERNVRVTLISRGYGAEAGSRNDEALELEQKLPDVPHLQNPDRVAAAQTAIEEFDAQLILLDDAFQHRRIHRDLDIVLIDALEPFGYGRLLPRGLLREPLAGLRRADILVLSRSDAVDDNRRALIQKEARRYTEDACWVEAAHRPAGLQASNGESAGLEALRDGRVAAFCGIGNPQGFRHSLRECGCDVVGFREFPDHHAYERADIESLGQWASDVGATTLVCTQKDLVKVQSVSLGDVPLWALVIEISIQAGSEHLENRLRPIADTLSSRQA